LRNFGSPVTGAENTVCRDWLGIPPHHYGAISNNGAGMGRVVFSINIALLRSALSSLLHFRQLKLTPSEKLTGKGLWAKSTPEECNIYRITIVPPIPATLFEIPPLFAAKKVWKGYYRSMVPGFRLRARPY